jgi:hypothetical protein
MPVPASRYTTFSACYNDSCLQASQVTRPLPGYLASNLLRAECLNSAEPSLGFRQPSRLALDTPPVPLPLLGAGHSRVWTPLYLVCHSPAVSLTNRDWYNIRPWIPPGRPRCRHGHCPYHLHLGPRQAITDAPALAPNTLPCRATACQRSRHCSHQTALSHHTTVSLASRHHPARVRVSPGHPFLQCHPCQPCLPPRRDPCLHRCPPGRSVH